MSLALHLNRLPQFWRYILIGGSITTCSYIAIFFCMYGLGMGARTSNALVYGIGIIFSYGMNRRYTFRSQGKKVPEAMRFGVVFTIAYAINFAVLNFLIMRGIHPALSQIIAGGFYVVSTFSANKLLVFKNTTRETK